APCGSTALNVKRWLVPLPHIGVTGARRGASDAADPPSAAARPGVSGAASAVVVDAAVAGVAPIVDCAVVLKPNGYADCGFGRAAVEMSCAATPRFALRTTADPAALTP